MYNWINVFISPLHTLRSQYHPSVNSFEPVISSKLYVIVQPSNCLYTTAKSFLLPLFWFTGHYCPISRPGQKQQESLPGGEWDQQKSILCTNIVQYKKITNTIILFNRVSVFQKFKTFIKLFKSIISFSGRKLKILTCKWIITKILC